jgi:hypothetical protein
MEQISTRVNEIHEPSFSRLCGKTILFCLFWIKSRASRCFSLSLWFFFIWDNWLHSHLQLLWRKTSIEDHWNLSARRSNKARSLLWYLSLCRFVLVLFNACIKKRNCRWSKSPNCDRVRLQNEYNWVSIWPRLRDFYDVCLKAQKNAL